MDFNVIEMIFGVAERLSSSNSLITIEEFLIMIFIVFIIVFIKEKSDSLINSISFSKSEFLYEILLGIMISILTVYGTQINNILSSVIGSILGIAIHDKLFKSNIVYSNSTVSSLSSTNNNLLDIENRLNELRNKEYYDILDILLIYEYISFNQYDIVIKKHLFSTPDEMVDELKLIPALTDEQLREARALINLIRIKGKLITRQELDEFIEQINKE